MLATNGQTNPLPQSILTLIFSLLATDLANVRGNATNYFKSQELGVLVGIDMMRGTDEVKRPFFFFLKNVPCSWPATSSHMKFYKETIPKSTMFRYYARHWKNKNIKNLVFFLKELINEETDKKWELCLISIIHVLGFYVSKIVVKYEIITFHFLLHELEYLPEETEC